MPYFYPPDTKYNFSYDTVSERVKRNKEKAARNGYYRKGYYRPKRKYQSKWKKKEEHDPFDFAVDAGLSFLCLLAGISAVLYFVVN